MKSIKMKPILIIATVLAFTLSACGAKAVPTVDPAMIQASAVAAANTMVAIDSSGDANGNSHSADSCIYRHTATHSNNSAITQHHQSWLHRQWLYPLPAEEIVAVRSLEATGTRWLPFW